MLLNAASVARGGPQGGSLMPECCRCALTVAAYAAVAVAAGAREVPWQAAFYSHPPGERVSGECGVIV